MQLRVLRYIKTTVKLFKIFQPIKVVLKHFNVTIKGRQFSNILCSKDEF